MNKLIVVSALLLASIASAQDTAKSSEVQILTRAAPTASSFTVTSGSTIGVSIDLRDVTKFRVSVCPVTAGATLSGAGTLDAYLLDDVDGEVKFNKDLRQTISVNSTDCSGAACRCQVFPDQSASRMVGRLIYAANGITVSSGTQVTVRIIAWKQR